MKYEEISTAILSTFGITISLAEFKTILDIILLIVSILNLLIILFFKLRRYLKDGKLTEEEKADLIKDIKTIQNTAEQFNEKLNQKENKEIEENTHE